MCVTDPPCGNVADRMRGVGDEAVTRGEQPFDADGAARVNAAGRYADFRAEANITSPIMSSSRYDARDPDPFFTLDRIAFWRKSAESG